MSLSRSHRRASEDVASGLVALGSGDVGFVFAEEGGEFGFQGQEEGEVCVFGGGGGVWCIWGRVGG